MIDPNSYQKLDSIHLAVVLIWFN